MGLQEQIAADVRNVLLNTDEFGESVTHTPLAGGDGSGVSGLFTEDVPEIDEREDGPYEVRRGTLLISTDADEGIASPARGDSFTIAGETWTVEEVHLMRHATAAQLDMVCATRQRLSAETHKHRTGGR